MNSIDFIRSPSVDSMNIHDLTSCGPCVVLSLVLCIKANKSNEFHKHGSNVPRLEGNLRWRSLLQMENNWLGYYYYYINHLWLRYKLLYHTWTPASNSMFTAFRGMSSVVLLWKQSALVSGHIIHCESNWYLSTLLIIVTIIRYGCVSSSLGL